MRFFVVIFNLLHSLSSWRLSPGASPSRVILSIYILRSLTEPSPLRPLASGLVLSSVPSHSVSSFVALNRADSAFAARWHESSHSSAHRSSNVRNSGPNGSSRQFGPPPSHLLLSAHSTQAHPKSTSVIHRFRTYPALEKRPPETGDKELQHNQHKCPLTTEVQESRTKSSAAFFQLTTDLASVSVARTGISRFG
eukprot:1192647-Prorocentrum_minimum.AAC.1